MNEAPNFGPYQKWESISTFATLSEEAHSSLDRQVQSHWKRLSRPVHHLFLRMAYQAKTTSLAIRLNNSWVLCLPAFALLRIRLEQTIVCSYLIHEEEDVGLKPFVSYIPVGQHKGLKAALEDPSLAAELTGKLDFEHSEIQAVKAQAELTPGFTIDDGKFQRNWTNLDLRSMAKRRDSLAAPKGVLYRHSLEREYLSIYKTASSVVHADCSSISHHYLDTFSGPSGQEVLMSVPSWAPIVAAALAHYDLLQCYEILCWLKIPADQQYESLMQQWISARDQYV